MTDALADARSALHRAGVDNVSRETLERLEAYIAVLREWSRAQNLVGPSALDDIWDRHVADSAQLVALAPGVNRWLDIGSGAGFPGLVVAALIAGRSEGSVILIESNARKCAFLREVGRVAELPIDVHHGRIEDELRRLPGRPEAISARALAPLAQLLNWTAPLLHDGAVAYFHKGLDFDRERAAIAHPDGFDLLQHKSRIGPGFIIEAHAADRPLSLET